MLLHEIINPNPAIRRLLRDIHFISSDDENKLIVKKLQKKHIKPTPNNIKKYLLQCFLMPLELIPQPERKIILRLTRPEPYERNC